MRITTNHNGDLVLGDLVFPVTPGANGEMLFVMKHVCALIGVHDYQKALKRLDPGDRGPDVEVGTNGGPQLMATLTESGLYGLVLSSRTPEARQTRKQMFRAIGHVQKHGHVFAEIPGAEN